MKQKASRGILGQRTASRNGGTDRLQKRKTVRKRIK